MIPKLTHEDLIEQSNIIQIALSDNESEIILEQINNILEYVSNIETFDVEGETEMEFMIDDYNRMREDIPTESLPLSEALKNAPSKNENFFKVPKVIE